MSIYDTGLVETGGPKGYVKKSTLEKPEETQTEEEKLGFVASLPEKVGDFLFGPDEREKSPEYDKPYTEQILEDTKKAPLTFPYSVGTAFADLLTVKRSARDDRFVDKAKQLGYDSGVHRGYENGFGWFTTTETSEYITGDGQYMWSFADTRDNVNKALESPNFFTLKPDGTQREFEVIEDEDAGLFSARYAVSVEKDDGTFTKFSPVIQDMRDFWQGTLPMVAIEGGAGLATTVGALLTGAAVVGAGTAGGTVAAVTLIPAAVLLTGYGLYVGGKGQVKFREMVKAKLGLTDEKADSLMEAFLELENKSNMFVPGRGDMVEEISGVANLILQIAPGIKDISANAISNVRKRFLQKRKEDFDAGKNRDSIVFESGFEASQFAKSNGGMVVKGADGQNEVIPLNKFLQEPMISQVVDYKVLHRVVGLAEQTSNILPKVVRKQMLSAHLYLKTWGNAIGKGSFDTYRETVDILEDTFRNKYNLTNIGRGLSGGNTDVLMPDVRYVDMDTSVGELNTLFRYMRKKEAQGLYNNFFDATRMKGYVLGTVTKVGEGDAAKFIPESGLLYELNKVIQVVIPLISNLTKNINIKGTKSSLIKENNVMAELIEDLAKMGKIQPDNTVYLSPVAMKNAMKDFSEKYGNVTGFKLGEGELENISPAKVLHLYAIRLGKLASTLMDQTTASGTQSIDMSLQNQATAALNLRQTILDLIPNFKSNPGGRYKAGKSVEKEDNAIRAKFAADLQEANDFYTEGLMMSNQKLLMLQVHGYKPSKFMKDEEIQFSTLILGPRGQARSSGQPFTQTLTQIKEMEEYVLSSLGYKYVDDVERPLPDGSFLKKLVKDEDATPLIKETDALISRASISGKTKGQRINVDDVAAYTRLRQAWVRTVSHTLAGTASTKYSTQEAADQTIKYIKSFNPEDLELLGIDEQLQSRMVRDAEIVGQLRQGFDAAGVDLSRDTPLVKVIADRLFTDGGKSAELETNLSTYLRIVQNSPNPAEALENLKQGIVEYIMSTESGAFRTGFKNSAYEQVGDIMPVPQRFMELTELLHQTPSISKIFSKDELNVLSGLANYSAVIQGAGADAGSALSGAQLIANLYTLEPAKFLSSITRLAAQKRVAKTLSDPRLVAIFSGDAAIKPDSFTLRASRYFIGKASVASVLSTIALEGGIKDMAEQTTEEKLNFESTIKGNSIYSMPDYLTED